LAVVPAVPGVPSAEELSALPAAELAVRLAEAHRLIAELTAQAERLTAQVERLSARVEELERQARQDSSTSSRPQRLIARIRRKAGTGRCGSGGTGGRESSPVIPDRR
jgi:chromosome segregation ATPase